MSHFTVMVFGDDPESALEPYDENIVMPEYIYETVKDTEINRFIEYYTKEHPEDTKDKTFDQIYELFGKDWNGNSWRYDEEGYLCEFSTYNPKSKWDWYQVGGRWTGYFKLKNGANGELGSKGIMTEDADEGTADVLRKGDIDIELMRKEAEDYAIVVYDKAKELIDKFGDGFVSWDKLDCSEDKKRDIYRNQPLVKAFIENNEIFGYFFEIEDFMVPRDKYIQDARNNAIATFAFITLDGEWVEKGEMGWWGMVKDEKGIEDWNKTFNTYFDSLPDDTQITLVDCHI